MKRETLIEYSKVIAVTLVISAVTAIFGAIQFFLEENTNLKNVSSVAKPVFTVVIDPGHGGEDGGAVGIGGSLEKDINLKISKYLEDFFSLVDLKVVMTRNTDTMLYKDGQQNRKKFYDLYNRVEICNSLENPLVISVHQNKFPVSKYKGLQVYYSKNNEGSRLFANTVQEKTKRYLQNDNSRESKQAGRNIFLLDKLNCPAVIVECGFLSNPEEEKKLCEDDYQRRLAFVIFSSVMDYINAGAAA